MKKLLRTLTVVSALVVSVPALGQQGPCDELRGACEQLVSAQANKINGLEDALKESRGQTEDALKRQNNNTGSGVSLVGILIGVALGAAVGAAVAH